MAKSMGATEFKHESLQDGHSIVKYLEALVNGLESGQLLFASGKNEMVLRPHGLLRFTVQAKRKDPQVKVTIKVAWKEHGEKEQSQQPLMIKAAQKQRG